MASIRPKAFVVCCVLCVQKIRIKGEIMGIKRIKPYIVRQLFFIAALLAIGNICFAVNEESALNIDKKTIKGMIKSAVPMIEDITGRDFKKKVKFKLVKRNSVWKAVMEGARPIYKKLLKDESDDAVARQLETTAVASSQFALGLYVPSEKKFLVVPDNVKFSVKTLGIEEEDFYDVVFLIVAHELVHALDDQYFDMQRIQASMDSSEAMLAFAALREGHAVYVTDRIAEKLKLSDTAKEISVKSAAGVMDPGDRAQMQIFHSTYVKGSEFVRAIVEKKGPAGVSEAFASPPVFTRQVMNPTAYLSPSIHTGLDCSKLLENIRPTLPIEGMQTQSVSLGAVSLSAVLISQGINEKEARMVAGECTSGAIFNAYKKTLKPKTLMIIALNFISRESAEKFLEMSRKTDASTEAQYNAKLNSTYKVVKDVTPELKGFDTTRYRHVEKETNGVVTTELSVEGLMENVYLAAAFVNMQEKITEEHVAEIISALGHERLKMK